MRTSTDSVLIEKCIEGDQAAWNELVTRYERLIYSVARTLCSAEDAGDIFQQVWLEVHRSLPNLRRRAALPAWLITVTRRRVYALIRSRRDVDPLDDEIPETSEEIRQIEREHTIERALARASARCRKLIELLYFTPRGPTYAEVAQIVGIPEASVGPTRARCLEKLRKIIG